MTKTKQTNKQKTHPDPAAKAEHTLQLKKRCGCGRAFHQQPKASSEADTEQKSGWLKWKRDDFTESGTQSQEIYHEQWMPYRNG